MLDVESHQWRALLDAKVPASLDEVVRLRARSVLSERASSTSEKVMAHATTDRAPPSRPGRTPESLPWPERAVYLMGLLFCGAEVAREAVRLLWSAWSG